jgi:hypothetical protein
MNLHQNLATRLDNVAGTFYRHPTLLIYQITQFLMHRSLYLLSASVSALLISVPNLPIQKVLASNITNATNQSLSNLTLAQSSGRILPREFYGTWKGGIDQPGSTDYQMILTLHKCQVGQRCGKFILANASATLCSGYLAYIRQDRNSYVMRSYLEQNSGGCVDGLNIFTLKSPNVLTEISVRENRAVAQGTLNKVIDQNSVAVVEQPRLVPRRPEDLCTDARYRRLLNERLQIAVKQKLNSDPNRILQPLGTYRFGMIADARRRIGTRTTWANYDEYKITIPKQNLPTAFNPQKFLKTWARDMNAVPIGMGKNQFDSINVFQSRPSNYQPRLGDVIDINIQANRVEGRADVMITDVKPTYFRVSTLTYQSYKNSRLNVPLQSDMHPVSGSREFGFESNSDGSVTFYTRGLDTPTWIAVDLFGVSKQREGWTGFMQGIGERFNLQPQEAKERVEQESFNDSTNSEPGCHIKP